MRTKNAFWATLLSVAPVLAAPLGCKSSPASTEVTDTRTNWLEACNSDAECGTALACLCGTCTIACTTDTQCTDLDEETVCRPAESCAATSAVCTRDGSNAAGGSAQGSGGAGGDESSATPSGGAENGGGRAANLGGGSTGSGDAGDGGAAPSSANGGTGGDTQTPAAPAGASSGNAGSSSGGAGGTGSMSSNAGNTSGGASSGGLALGETCYSTSEAVTDTCASGSFCDPAQVCTDAIPPSCWSSCTCNGPGQQCRTEQGGEVLLDRPCCSGYACVPGAETPDSGQQAYFCQEDTDATCAADCDVTANSPSCEDRPGFPHLWMCRSTPDAVLAGCIDLATNLPRACCPATVLPQCVP